MPAVIPAFAAVGGAFTAAASTAGAVLGGTALGGGAGGAILAAFTKVAIGVSLSIAARAILPQQQAAGPSGTKISMQFGETAPASFIMGRYATAGDLVYHGSWDAEDDTPNEYYVQVIELSDLPASLERVWINGEWATLGETAEPNGLGYPVEGYDDGGHDRLFVKFYDGSQTVADAYLVAKFGDDPTFPWTTDMIGRGVAYAIVTAGYRPEVHVQKPQCLFELTAVHYDRRKDSTAGGDGAHRWNDRSTWEPSENLVVLIDNVLRGIKDPVTGEFLWGGKGIENRDLPSSAWFAAMNACDVDIDLNGGGTEPQFHGGIEVTVDKEPAAIIEELLAGCQGQIAECAGEWLIRVGAPGASVYAITDDDIVTTSADTFTPFPAITESINVINSTYPDPKAGWTPTAAPERKKQEYIDEDGGLRNEQSILYSAVFSKTQVQRNAKAALDDGRRFRLHNAILPFDARKLAPLDTISWTSERNGYSNKQFEITLIADQTDGNAAVALREVDPDDYSWDTSLELPTAVNDGGRNGPRTKISLFNFAPAYAKDSAGNQRSPAVDMTWSEISGTTGVRYQGRLVADPSHQPVDGRADISNGHKLITSVLRSETYEFRGRFEPISKWKWSSWQTVTTPAVGITEDDFADALATRIDDLAAIADQAGADAVAAFDKATQVEATVEGLNEDILDQLQGITDELAGIDTGSIQEMRGIAVAGLRDGWLRNPKFAEWTGTAPDDWTVTNGSTLTESSDGYWGTGALFQSVPTDPFVQLVASSANSGEAPAADFNSEYVVVEAMLYIPSGTITTNQYLRAEWRHSPTQAWTRGDAFGAANAFGVLGPQWGFSVSASNSQSKSFIFKKPSGVTPDAVRLVIRLRNGGDPAVTIRIDALNLRAATDAEIKAFQANGYADAAIETLEQTIVGPTGAIASAMDVVRAEFGAADATVQTSVNAVSTEVQSLAGRITTVEATYGGNNNAKNPDFFDGIRPAGQTPTFWNTWQSAFSVIARGSTGANAVVNALTPFIGHIAGGTSAVVANPHGFVPITKGARVSVGFEMAGIGSGINVSMQALIDWYDADKVLVTSSGDTIAVTNTGWSSPDWGSFEAPAGASYYKMRIRRVSGGSSNDIVFTNVYSRIVDAKSYARAEESAVAAADANSAISQWRTKVEASYNGYDAFLASTVATASASSTNTATIASWQSAVTARFANFSAFAEAGLTAVTTADLAASTYVVRATAGGGTAGLRVVAFDDETGSGGSVTLFGDYVIAPGTLSTQALVVTDLGMNKVPDDQIQSDRVWGGSGVGYVLIQNTSRGGVSSIGELHWNFSSGSEMAEADGGDFPVRANQRLYCEFEMVASGNAYAGAQLRYAAADGTFVGTQTIAMISSSNTSTRTGSTTLVVPSGAARARFRFRVDKSQTNNNVRFFGPKVIEQSDGTILITPNSITGAQLVATDVLIANEAQIGNLVVGTSNIKNNAVTDTFQSYNENETSFPGSDLDGWNNIQSFSITKTGNTPVVIEGVCEVELDGNHPQKSIGLRIVRVNTDNSTTAISTGFGTAVYGSWNTLSVRGWDTTNWSGSRTFRLQIQMFEGVGDLERINVQKRFITGGQMVVPKK